MTPIDEMDMARLLGEIEGRLVGMDAREQRIETTIQGWEHRCQACTNRLEERLRRCEETRAQAIMVGGIMGLLAGLSGWLKEFWQ